MGWWDVPWGLGEGRGEPGEAVYGGLGVFLGVGWVGRLASGGGGSQWFWLRVLGRVVVVVG